MISDEFEFKLQLLNLLCMIPWLIVTVVGGCICLRRMWTRPREGWLVGISIALFLFAGFGLPNLINIAVRYIPFMQMSGFTAPYFIVLYALPMAITNAVAWGLLIYTAFVVGSVPRSRYLIEDQSGR